MALDLSGRTDDEIRLAFNSLGSNPERFANNPEYVRALQREYNRRFQSPPAAEPDNVAANLAAAAAPLEVDPTPMAATPKTWKGMSDEELVAPVTDAAGVTNGDLQAYGERYRQALGNVYESGVARRKAALAAGIQDPDQAAYNAATGLGEPSVMATPATVLIDGVRVPTHTLSDGKSFGGMYTLRDLRMAKDAADEERLASMFSRSAQEDLAKYGTANYYEYVRDPQTGEILRDPKTRKPVVAENAPLRNDALAARRAMESRQQSQNAALRDRPELQQLESESRALRRMRSHMAALAGGSQNLNSGNIGSYYALVSLPQAQRDLALQQMLPINPQRAQMEAVGAQNALRLLSGVNMAQGNLFNNPLAAAQAAVANQELADRRRASRAGDEDVLGEKYARSGWLGYDEFTIAEQQSMYEDLLARGYQPAEAQAAVDAQANKRRATDRAVWNE